MASKTRWIVAVLGSGNANNDGQKHLDILLKVLESYVNPANAGSVRAHASYAIQQFFMKLAKGFVNRVHRERHAKRHWWRVAKEEASQLTDEDIDR